MGLGIYTKLKELIHFAHKLKSEKNIQAVEITKYESDLLFGKRALIVGGTGGIGFSIANAFINVGCKVVITGTKQETLTYALNKLPRGSSGLVLDLLNPNIFEKKIIEAQDLLAGEKIDIFVNAAGFHGNEPFGSVSEETYDRVLDINLKGMYFMVQAAGDYMKKNGVKGHILNVSSAAALKPAWTPYEISKWGVRALTLGAADELIPYGIVVNAIAPGPVATSMLSFKEGDTLYTDCVPTERFATPKEIAQLAVVMASDLCNLVIGDTFYITGGSGTIRYR